VKALYRFGKTVIDKNHSFIIAYRQLISVMAREAISIWGAYEEQQAKLGLPIQDDPHTKVLDAVIMSQEPKALAAMIADGTITRSERAQNHETAIGCTAILELEHSALLDAENLRAHEGDIELDPLEQSVWIDPAPVFALNALAENSPKTTVMQRSIGGLLRGKEYIRSKSYRDERIGWVDKRIKQVARPLQAAILTAGTLGMFAGGAAAIHGMFVETAHDAQNTASAPAPSQSGEYGYGSSIGPEENTQGANDVLALITVTGIGLIAEAGLISGVHRRSNQIRIARVVVGATSSLRRIGENFSEPQQKQ
jgi:hypothetical protein